MIKKSITFALSCLLALGVWLTVSNEPVQACSCASPPNPREEVSRKTAVFAGKVQSITQPDNKKTRSSADPVKVTFEVQSVWKGDLKGKTTVYTASSSASCGYTAFAPDREYLVFAYGSSERLETNICTLTKPLATAAAELTALGTGYAPSAEETHSAEPAEEDGSDGSIIPSIILLALMAGASVIFAVLRKRYP